MVEDQYLLENVKPLEHSSFIQKRKTSIHLSLSLPFLPPTFILLSLPLFFILFFFSW